MAEEDNLGFDILADADAENNVATAQAYQVLARKYRPQNFEDMIGQEAMVQTLHNAFDTGRIAHAFMLTGVRGVGKTTTARILARALNFETDTVHQPSIDLSSLGKHCEAIMEGRHVDIMEMDAASRTGINDIREIIEGVRYGPGSARYKIYIIDEVHMLSTAAFNGLLKTLEEPPPYVKFIFATTEIRKVPVTVLSRCQRFDLRRLTVENTLELLHRVCKAEGETLGEEPLTLIARAAEGSARDALSLLDRALAHAGDDAQSLDGDMMRQLLGLADRGRVFDLMELVLKGDIPGLLHEFESQYNQGADPSVILGDLGDLTHWLTRLKFVDGADKDVTISAEQRRRGRDLSDGVSMRVLARNWQVLLKGHQEVLMSVNPKAAAEMVLIRLGHLADMPTPDALIQQYEKANSSPSASSSAPSSATVSGSASGTSGGASTSPSSTSPSSTLTQTIGEASVDASAVQASAHPNSQTVLAMASNSSAEVAPSPQAGLPAPAMPGIHLKSFADLLGLVQTNRDVALKHALESGVHLVSFQAPHQDQSGRIELRLVEGQENIAQDLTKKLRLWTSQPWIVSLSREAGAPTIKSVKLDTLEQRQLEARQDPLVQAALKAFPDAEIVAITDILPPAHADGVSDISDASDGFTDTDSELD